VVFSRFPADESLRRTGLHVSLPTKSSFYLPAFEISRLFRTVSGEIIVKVRNKARAQPVTA
jgi:hypothetical protein